MQWPHLPIVPLLVCLILGYSANTFMGFNTSYLGILLLFGLLLFFGAKQSIKQKHQAALKSLAVYLFFTAFAYGFHAWYYHTPSQHYSRLNNLGTYVIVLEETLSSRGKSTRFYGRILQNNQRALKGRLLVNLVIEKEEPYTSGDLLLTAAALSPIATASSLEHFDYARYLERLGIQHQLVLFPNQFIRLDKRYSNLKIEFLRLRNRCLQLLQKSALSAESKQTLAALIWGQRQALDDEQIKAYTKAGAVHLLAISGLHIGLITFFLLMLLRPLKQFKNGQLVQQIVVVVFLWSYALITGMLPSVVRAVCLFSLWGVLHLRRQLQSPLNITLVSAFILLLFYPPYLFSVGFQMSYFAVIGIIVGVKRLSNWWKPKQKLLRYVWNLSLVSLCAQAAVAPLSIFYFKQFPGLFFITNLLLLPAFGVLLGTSYLLMLGVALQIHLPVLSVLHASIVHYYSFCIGLIAAQETFLFEGLQLYWWEVIFCYVFLFLLFQKRVLSKKYRPYTTSLLMTLLGVLLLQRESLRRHVEWWVVKNYETVVIAAKSSTGMRLWVGDTTAKITSLRQKLTTHFSTTTTTVYPLPHFFINEDKRLLICTDSLAFSFQSFKPTHLIMSQSPKLNFKRLVEQLQPKQIVFTGDNAKWLVAYWQQSCRELNIPCHDVATAGSFKIIP